MKYTRNKNYTYEWNTLSLLDLEIKLGIKTLRKIAENQAHFVNSLELDIDTKIANDEVLSTLAHQYQSSYFFQTYNSDIDLMNEIVRFQRYAMVLSIYSFLECRMLELCMVIVEKFGLKEEFDNIHENEFLKKCRKFLTKVCNTNMTDADGCYTILKEQKFTRNKITHENGTFKPKDLNKFKKVDGISSLPVGDGNHLILIENDQYCEFLLNKTESFLISILPEIDSIKVAQIKKKYK